MSDTNFESHAYVYIRIKYYGSEDDGDADRDN